MIYLISYSFTQLNYSLVKKKKKKLICHSLHILGKTTLIWILFLRINYNSDSFCFCIFKLFWRNPLKPRESLLWIQQCGVERRPRWYFDHWPQPPPPLLSSSGPFSCRFGFSFLNHILPPKKIRILFSLIPLSFSFFLSQSVGSHSFCIYTYKHLLRPFRVFLLQCSGGRILYCFRKARRRQRWRRLWRSCEERWEMKEKTVGIIKHGPI